MKRLNLYKDPLRFEMIPICEESRDRLKMVCNDAEDLIAEYDSCFLLRFYTSYDIPTDQVDWLMFEGAMNEILKILPNSCFVINSEESVKQELQDQGFQELIQLRSEKIELDEHLLVSPTESINDKTMLLTLMKGNWTRFDLGNDQGIKEILFVHESADELKFIGDRRCIIPKGGLIISSVSEDTLDGILKNEVKITDGSWIKQFSNERFIRMEIYTEKDAQKRLVAIRFY